MKTLLHIILLIMVILSSAGCGLLYQDEGEEGASPATARQKAGTAFLGGGAHSVSPHYEFDHRINISPTDGVERGPHYEIRPGY